MTRTYVIEGVPRSGKNSQRIAVNRRTGNRFTMKSKAAAKWLATATEQLALQHKGPPIEGPVRVDAVFYQRGDVCDGDNMQALLWDGLKGLVIADDKSVVEWRGAKRIDRTRPRIEVTVFGATPTM